VHATTQDRDLSVAVSRGRGASGANGILWAMITGRDSTAYSGVLEGLLRCFSVFGSAGAAAVRRCWADRLSGLR